MRRYWAREAVLSSDAEAMRKLANWFELVISTVPKAYPMQPLLGVLKLERVLVNVGALDQLQDPN